MHNMQFRSSFKWEVRKFERGLLSLSFWHYKMKKAESHHSVPFKDTFDLSIHLHNYLLKSQHLKIKSKLKRLFILTSVLAKSFFNHFYDIQFYSQKHFMIKERQVLIKQLSDILFSLKILILEIQSTSQYECQTRATRVQHDTSASRVLHKRQECETSATRVRHE